MKTPVPLLTSSGYEVLTHLIFDIVNGFLKSMP